MTEEIETRTNEKGIEEKKCPHCGDWKDPRGFSSHESNCPERTMETENKTQESEQTQETMNEEEYEEVTSGEKVEVNENPTCDECPSVLVEAQKYASQLREIANSGEYKGQKVPPEIRSKFRENANWLENKYAYCVNCELGYEKSEL